MNVGASAICLIIALVIFAFAALFHWFRPNENRVNLVALGLFFYALKDLVGVVIVVAALRLLGTWL